MFFFSLNRRFIFKVNNCLGSVNATVKRIPQVLALPLIKLFILIIINDNNKNNIVLQNTTYEKALDNMRKHWNHSVYETGKHIQLVTQDYCTSIKCKFQVNRTSKSASKMSHKI
uniref:Uncharacterized protein n=1 Tax=Cacopsylla melanoneura TaxID=428564 RepID=A0A8D9DTF8_9HEMI